MTISNSSHSRNSRGGWSTGRRTRRALGPLAAFGLLALCSLHPVVVGTARGDAGGCKEAMITGESHVDPETGAYIGAGTIGLDGVVNDIQWVSVITGVVVGPGGTLALTGSHHITGTHDSSIDFITVDEVSAVPTEVPGQYVFSSHLAVVSGSGRVHSGSLGVIGRFDLFQGNVAIDSSAGTLCASP